MRIPIFCMLLLSVPGPASAQDSGGRAGQQPGLGGPVVPGVCLLSREAIFANAKAGIAASARIKQLTDAAQAEVEAQRKPIDADVQTFQKDAPRLAPDQRTQREQALAARLRPVQSLANQRSREIEATRVKALERISAEAQPVIAQVYTLHKCGLLIDRNSVLGGNLANDLTEEMVRALDAKMPTISFERETLPESAAK